MKVFIFFLALSVCFLVVFNTAGQAQNAIVTDDPAYVGHSAAMLDVNSIDKGFLIPRLNTAQMNGISSLVSGLMVFNTTLNSFCYYNGVEWIALTSQLLTANAGLDEPLFKILNAAGDTVFAVFPEGVRIKVGDGIAKGSGNKGGFAVGGFGTGKIVTQEYLRITNDSVRIYVNPNPPKGSGNKGGFAVGGFGTGKTLPENFMHLNPDNYFIGQGAGKSINGGKYNSFIGYQSGFKNTTGNKNYFIGYRSGFNNIAGYSNIFIGDSAGYTSSLGYNNIFIGNQSGSNNTIGSLNVAAGCQALFHNTVGNSNSACGNQALYNNSTGSANTAYGWASLFSNTINNGNTAMGYGSLMTLSNGNGNTAVGTMALSATTTAVNNTALGINAFATSDIVWNSTALGAGAQINSINKVRIGDVNVAIIEGQPAYYTPSDGRFKNNVKEEVVGLDFITRLNPIIYNFDTKKFDEFLMKNMPENLRNEIISKKDYSESSSIRQSGFIAQEVEQAAIESGFVFNGVHHPVNGNDNYSIAYSLFTVPLIKAVQELNTKNQELEIKNVELLQRIEAAEKINTELNNRLNALEKALMNK